MLNWLTKGVLECIRHSWVESILPIMILVSIRGEVARILLREAGHYVAFRSRPDLMEVDHSPGYYGRTCVDGEDLGAWSPRGSGP